MAESHRLMAAILEKMCPFPSSRMSASRTGCPGDRHGGPGDRHGSPRPDTPRLDTERTLSVIRGDTMAHSPEVEDTSDDDHDTDLEDDFGHPAIDPYDSVYVYRSACKRLRVVPSVSVCQQMEGGELCIDNYNMGGKSIMAIALALVNNFKLSVLKLAGNNMGKEGIRFLCEVLKENTTISYIDISNNSLGTYGASCISAMLKVNTTLHSLNVSGNNFRERDASYFSRALESTVDLHYLNLSNNEFREIGGIYLGKALGNNVSLEFIDLSWNHLRLRGGVAVARGLQDNHRLKVINISWNGLANEGAKALGRALRHNASLLELDVTCNRVNMEGAVALAEGLRYNSALRWLKLSKNPITTTGACCLLRSMLESEVSNLHTLELLDIEVNPKFKELLDEVRALRVIDVLHGGQVRHSDPYAKRTRKHRQILGDPLALLMEHVKKSSIRLMDLFAQLDKDNSMSLTRTEFKRGMKMAKVPLNDIQIDKLMDKLDLDKDGEISFAELLDGQRRYRERERKKNQLPTIASLRPLSSKNRQERPRSGVPPPRARAPSLAMTSSLGDTRVTSGASIPPSLPVKPAWPVPEQRRGTVISMQGHKIDTSSTAQPADTRRPSISLEDFPASSQRRMPSKYVSRSLESEGRQHGLTRRQSQLPTSLRPPKSF